MKNLKEYIETRKSHPDKEKEFVYSAVPGKTNIIQIIFYDDDGKKQSTLIETFSDKQFELFEKLKKKIKELRENGEMEERLFKS